MARRQTSGTAPAVSRKHGLQKVFGRYWSHRCSLGQNEILLGQYRAMGLDCSEEMQTSEFSPSAQVNKLESTLVKTCT